MGCYEKFEKAHMLLKEYGAVKTFEFEKEYTDSPIFKDNLYFYQTLEEKNSDNYKLFEMGRRWKEEIDGELDVVVKTKTSEAVLGIIRFDISYSNKAGKYDMYISLPTHSRSISLSKGNYSSQEQLIGEISKWLMQAKCKKPKITAKKSEIQPNQQLSMF